MLICHTKRELEVSKVSFFWQLIVIITFFRIPTHDWFAEIFTIGSHKIFTSELIFIWFYIFLMASVANRQLMSSFPNHFKTLVIYLIFVIFSSLAAHDLGLAIKGATISVASVVLYLMIVQLYRTDSSIRMAIAVLVGAGVLLGLYFIISYLKPSDITLRRVRILGSMYQQWTIPGADKNTVAMQMAILVPCAIFLSKTSTGLRKYFWVGTGVFLFFILVLTFSRGATLSLLGALVYLFVKRWFKIRAIIIASILAGGTLYLADLASVFFLRILSVLGYISEDVAKLLVHYQVFETSDRLATVGSSLQFFLQSPVFGIGPLNLSIYQGAEFGGAEHITFLALLAESGIFALMAFAGFLLLCYTSARKVLSSRSNETAFVEGGKDLGELLIAVLIANLIHLNVATPIYTFWVCTALLTAWSRNHAA